MRAIAELDALMAAELQAVVREGHPEVTFTVLNGRTPVVLRKKAQDGAASRRALIASELRQFGIPRDGELSIPRGAKRDDVLDALAMVVSATRGREGSAVVFPEGHIQADAHGLRAEMIA